MWQWKDHVPEEEALHACRAMMQDMSTSKRINWRSMARDYIMRARKTRKILQEIKPEKKAIPTEPTVPDNRSIVPSQQPVAAGEKSLEELVGCGKYEITSVVIKGTGDIPEKYRMFGDEWELRLIQRGTCCRTKIFRLKKTTEAKRTILKFFEFEGKWRGDVRWASNLCTGKEALGGRLSWEGKFTILRFSKLEEKLKEKGYSAGAGGVELVFKPQIGFNFTPAINQGKDIRVTFFIKARVGLEISVGNKIIFEIRGHPFECDLAWVEIDWSFGAPIWEEQLEECFGKLVEGIKLPPKIPRIEPKLPTIPQPWYKQSDVIDFRDISF